MSLILIADDDPLMIRLLEFNLKRAGHALCVCRDGLEVEQTARGHRPDLAILDVMLPGKSGLELIRDFRASESFADLPVIVVTGHGETQVHEDLMAAGANRVFTKPFAPSLLLATINELLPDKTHS